MSELIGSRDERDIRNRFDVQPQVLTVGERKEGLEIARILTHESIQASYVTSLEEVKTRVTRPDLVILDIDRVNMRDFRKVSGRPFVAMSSISDSDKKSITLENGAENYLTKPINPWDLRFQSVSVLKRIRDLEGPSLLTYGDLQIDLKQVLVTKDGTTIPMPLYLYKTLVFLIQNRNRIHTRKELTESVRGEGSYWDGDRRIDVYVNNLRKLLDKNGNPSSEGLIKTVSGMGYGIITDKTLQ